jgi:hypothetical protein
VTAAALSMVVSSDSASATARYMARERRAPGGGIMPARSLRIIFSATSACCGASPTTNDASDSPPDFPRSLWQPAQYCRTSAVCGSEGLDRPSANRPTPSIPVTIRTQRVSIPDEVYDARRAAYRAFRIID